MYNIILFERNRFYVYLKFFLYMRFLVVTEFFIGIYILSDDKKNFKKT